jgi:Abnormal spindle-like microcephaly-assoc'd, ASPM-SPD-2-Hydin
LPHLIRAARRLVLVVFTVLATTAIEAPAVFAAGDLVAEPEGVAFGAVTVGEQRSMQLAFRNVGPNSVVLGDAWLVYDENATVEPFSVDSGSCSFDGVLPADTACQMTVTFAAPQSLGAFDALVVLEGNEVDPAVALLSGQSVTPPPPPPPPLVGKLVAEPATIGFPRTRLGSVSAARQVRVRNAGSGPIAVPAVTVSNSHFEVTSNNCPAQLQAGAECLVSLVFKPTSGPPRPIGWGVGETRQRGGLLFGQRNPVTRRYELSVALSGDTSPPLDFATIKTNLATVSTSVPTVLRGGPRTAFLTAFTAPEAGSLKARVYGWVGKRRVLVAKGSESFMAGERYALPISSTRQGRRLLRRPQRTRIGVVLTFRAADGISVTRERTFKVKAPKVKKPAKRKKG